MDYQASGNRLTITLVNDFNVLMVRKIDDLARDKDEVVIDLAQSRFVDSEAVRLLCSFVASGKNLTLRNPPKILREVVEVLGLETVLDLDKITEVKR